jgi:capsular polysaccharide biosynthesis protein/Mrp family chromosome partitioning ATPase
VPTVELDTYLRAVLRHWWLVLGTVLIAVAVAGVFTETREKVYESASTALVVVDSGRSSADLADAAQSRAVTYAAIANSEAIATVATADLRTDEAPSELLRKVDVQVTPETALIRVSARDTSRAAADRLADAWMGALTARVDEIETGESETDASGATVAPTAAASLDVVETAVSSSDPVYPRPPLNLAVGLLLGLLVGVGAALLLDTVRRRVRSASQIGGTWGVDVLGELPALARRSGRRVPLLALVDDGAPAAAVEQIRQARLKLGQARPGGTPHQIVVTSPSPGEGASTVALELAAAVAAGGEPTVLVEADLARPVMARDLDLDADRGLWQVLEEGADLDDVLQDNHDQPGLRHLVAGAVSRRGAELFGSEDVVRLLRDLAEDHVVVVDAPAVLDSSVAAVVCQHADGVVLVTPPEPRVDTVTDAFDHLDVVRADVLGLVTTASRRAGVRGALGRLVRPRPVRSGPVAPAKATGPAAAAASSGRTSRRTA